MKYSRTSNARELSAKYFTKLYKWLKTNYINGPMSNREMKAAFKKVSADITGEPISFDSFRKAALDRGHTVTVSPDHIRGKVVYVESKAAYRNPTTTVSTLLELVYDLDELDSNTKMRVAKALLGKALN